MDPHIFSPASPSEVGTSFDTSMHYSASIDSLCPLLSSHDTAVDPLLFDAYITQMVARDMKHPAAMSPIASDLEEPLIDDSPSQATITQQRESNKLKKKRSLGQALKSLKSSSRDITESLIGSRRVPFPAQIEDTSLLTIGSETLPGSAGTRRPEEEDAFDDRNRTVRRRNMPHHPFRSEDVPYMQAYNQILLENDYQTHQLLSRLIRSDSPTFHNYGRKPPSDVLDLGCGEGFWVLQAAKTWKSHSTKVTGLDLIDVHNNEVGEVFHYLEPAHVPKNVTWRRANFVKYALPFPDDSFDLVRMANLTLCIPISKWKFVLTQVRRVLRPGGRLELIDDDLFFPNVLPRPSREAPISSFKRPSVQRVSSASDMFRSTRTSSLLPPPVTHKALPDLPSASLSADKKHGHRRTTSEVDHDVKTTISQHLETVFHNMLSTKYGITPHPHLFLERLLREIFGGPESAREAHKLELVVPSRELSESCESLGMKAPSATLSPSPSPGHINRHSKRLSEDDKYKKRYRAPSPNPFERKSEEGMGAVDPRMLGSLTPKARQLLFGDGENPNKTPSWRASGPYQPPGLVLLPSTLIPCTPVELEMHACKHMNTLLGCKYALSKYVALMRDRNGMPLVSEKELDNFLWDYECFRRKRFNWPLDVPGLQMEDDPEELPPTPQPSKSNNIFKFATLSPQPVERERANSTGGSTRPPVHGHGGAIASTHSSAHVRTIRVYEAVKVHAVPVPHKPSFDLI